MLNDHEQRRVQVRRGVESAVEYCLLVPIVILTFYILRLPTEPLRLAYYDDSETLYHAMTFLSGRIPYLDDYSHHFMGYALPIAAWAKVFGLSDYTIREYAFFNQTLSSMCFYACARSFTGPLQAGIAALLLISAREPWVLGFYQQYQINLFTCLILLCSLRYLKGDRWYIWAGAAISGCAFISDQRAGALLFIPAIALLSRAAVRRNYTDILVAALCFAAIVAAPAVYLYQAGAWSDFIEQTWHYPRTFRLGSQGILDFLYQSYILHRYLWTETPVHFVAGVCGYVTFIFHWLKSRRSFQDSETLLLALLPPLLVMPLFGGKDHEYYSMTWMPLLCLGCALLTELPGLKKVYRRLISLCLVTPVIISLYLAIDLKESGRFESYTGDGTREVTEYLRANIRSGESLFVWGYRLDIYVRLGMQSNLPFANIMIIHPEDLILDEAQRLAHVYPEYEERFAEMVKNELSDWVVYFWRGDRLLNSRARELLLERLNSDYELQHEIHKPDLLGEVSHFRIFRRRNH